MADIGVQKRTKECIVFEYTISVLKRKQMVLCVTCSLCRDIVVSKPTYRDIPIDGGHFSASMDLHVCTAQRGNETHNHAIHQAWLDENKSVIGVRS